MSAHASVVVVAVVVVDVALVDVTVVDVTGEGVGVGVGHVGHALQDWGHALLKACRSHEGDAASVMLPHVRALSRRPQQNSSQGQ